MTRTRSARRPRGRHRPRRRRPRRRDRRRGHAGRDPGEPELADRPVSDRRAVAMPVPAKRRKRDEEPRAHASPARRGNNLKNVTAEIPLGTFTCVTGVSGSASRRSSSTRSTRPWRASSTARRSTRPRTIASTGLEHLDKVIDIDQSPIGRTPRSNPATYTGAFTPIRDWFAGLPEAKARGYKPGRFSLQRQGRPLRGVPGRRRDQDRDALPARRLRHLRRLQRQALQPRDAGGEVQAASPSPTCST